MELSNDVCLSPATAFTVGVSDPYGFSNAVPDSSELQNGEYLYADNPCLNMSLPTGSAPVAPEQGDEPTGESQPTFEPIPATPEQRRLLMELGFPLPEARFVKPPESDAGDALFCALITDITSSNELSYDPSAPATEPEPERVVSADLSDLLAGDLINLG